MNPQELFESLKNREVVQIVVPNIDPNDDNFTSGIWNTTLCNDSNDCKFRVSPKNKKQCQCSFELPNGEIVNERISYSVAINLMTKDHYSVSRNSVGNFVCRINVFSMRGYLTVKITKKYFKNNKRKRCNDEGVAKKRKIIVKSEIGEDLDLESCVKDKNIFCMCKKCEKVTKELPISEENCGLLLNVYKF